MPEYSDSTFFVSPQGNDSWSGKLCCPNADRTDGPFATLSRARTAARALEHNLSKRIIVRGGDYYDIALELYASDSNLTIEAAEGETVNLYGGHQVTGWTKEPEGNFWSAELPGVKEGRWDPRLLIVNGRFCLRARLPKEGAFTHESVFDVPWMSTTLGGWQRPPTREELTTLKYKESDLGDWLEVKNAELTIYHAWDDSLVGIKSIDTGKRVVTFSTPAGHPPGAFASWNAQSTTYVVWNVREGMTDPGQWYLDRVNGRVVYWPLPGEDLTQAQVFMPTTETIIHIRDIAGGAVRNLTLRGLNLSLTTTPLIAAGFGADNLDGAITADAALVDCGFENLKIHNIAGHGIKARNSGNLRVRVEGCEIEYTGAGGICVSSSDGVITENLVTHVGLMYPAAIGIFSSGNRLVINHNDIYDTSYTGINTGGTGVRVEYNDIARVMLVLNDGAAIYSIFPRELVLRGNVVWDVVGNPEGRHAYYLDEQAEHCVVTGNLALGVASPSENHWARHNRIENNVFIYDGDILLHFPRSTDYTIARNIIVATGKIQFRNIEAITCFEHNICFTGQGAIEGVHHKDQMYQSVRTVPIPSSEDTLNQDPLFVDAEHGDYRFRPGSPAERLGIEPIDISQAGRTKK